MKLTAIVGSILGVAAMSVFTLSAQGAKTQWDGVYTAEQAKRGEPLYASRCGQCHAGDLTGYADDYNPAPELTGDPFVKAWDTFTLADMFDKISKTMPQDEPGILKPEQYAEVIAFILQVGKYPAGTTELPANMDALKGIKFVATKP
jgi:mono/diheme cytochrome c family protein